jgi:spore germination protein YaaH
VLDYALEDIDADKVLLGVPTYGRAWDVTVAPDWYKDYTSVEAINHVNAVKVAKKYNVEIGRTEGGEAVISYFPEDSVYKVFNALEAPKGTPKGFEAAAKALMVANYTGLEIPVRFITWSDAEAIEDKLELAKKYNLKGIAVFKFDGEEDSKMWDLF